MAIYRKIHVSFWADPFVMDLTPDQKFFYLYLLTNDKTKQCGIYELPLRQICFDTGFSEDEVKKLINHFVSAKKIKYSANFREIALKNWIRYNGSESPKVNECVCNEIQHVKDDDLIQYVYGIDRVSILKRNKNKNKKKNNKEEQEKEPNIHFDEFWKLYDKKVEKEACRSKWNKLTDEERTDIIAYLPNYIKATPDKKFRKNPETFLNGNGWEDEIIMPRKSNNDPPPLGTIPARLKKIGA